MHLIAVLAHYTTVYACDSSVSTLHNDVWHFHTGECLFFFKLESSIWTVQNIILIQNRESENNMCALGEDTCQMHICEFDKCLCIR